VIRPVDEHAPEPSYVQLAAMIREGIESGEYAPRTAIPSIMEIVGQTGLAIGTVRHAIGVLAEEGLVQKVSGRGTFVVQR
jgi:GntR family transcriptional regulator